MSKKIKVGNAEVEKANYDYFLLQYSKISKEYVIADLVSKCEDYEKLYNAYEKLEVEKIQKENIRKEIREYIMTELITEWDIKNNGYVSGSDLPADAITPILEILDKENKQ